MTNRKNAKVFRVKNTIIITMMILMIFELFLKTATGATVILQDCEDTYIYSPQPTGNYGSEPYFWLNHADKRRPLLKFDLSFIPSTAKIIKAELRLYADAHASFEDPIDPFIMPLLESWTENGATWNTRDGTTPWTQAGGYFDEWTLNFFYKPIEYYEINQWHTADITSLVQSWVNSSLPNHGMIISQLTTGSNKRHRFISREGEDPSLRPKLEITYTDNGSLTLPDTFVHPDIIRRADSHVFQHLNQDMTMTFNDMQEIGGRYFYLVADAFNFAHNDSWIDEALARGMTVILDVYAYQYIVGKTYQEIYDVGAALAEHYKGRVSWYETSSEINNKWYSYSKPEHSPEQFTAGMHALYDGVKSKDPNAKIGTFKLGSTNPWRYIEACVEYGLANWTEMWGYGVWHGGPDSRIPDDRKNNYLRNWRLVHLARKEGDKVGHPISVQQEGMTKDTQGRIYQAKIIARKTVLNQYIGMLPHEWYKLYDPSHENFQLVSDDFQTKYEGFYTLKYLNQHLNPSKYPPVHMGIMTTPAHFYKFAFKASDTEVVLALWDARKPPTNSFDPGTKVDVTFLDYGLSPVKIVDPISGEVVDSSPDYTAKAGKVTIQNVEMVDYPRLIIMERNRTPTNGYGKLGQPKLKG